MNELHVFAGAGGGILGGMLLGHRTVCAVEIEPYCRKVLLQRQRDGVLPWFPIWDDVRNFDGRPWRGLVDVVCGGFPCQAFSTAARGRTAANNLWPEMLRIIGEVSPKHIFAENVSEDAIVQAQADLAECGYSTRRAKVSAADVGADHIRARWWLFADTNDKSKLVCQIHAEMADIEKCRPRVWSAYARESRVAYGVANRTHRLKAIGNGQVPAVAALAWRILSGDVSNERSTR